MMSVDGTHLAIAIVGPGEFASHPLQCGRQHPVHERRTVAQRARLAGQNRHVMPWIVDRLAPAIAAAMFGDDVPVLTIRSAPGSGRRPARGQAPAWISTGRPTAPAFTEYLLLS